MSAFELKFKCNTQPRVAGLIEGSGRSTRPAIGYRHTLTRMWIELRDIFKDLRLESEYIVGAWYLEVDTQHVGSLLNVMEICGLSNLLKR